MRDLRYFPQRIGSLRQFSDRRNARVSLDPQQQRRLGCVTFLNRRPETVARGPIERDDGCRNDIY